MNMRGTPRVLMIAPGIRTWPYSNEAISPFTIRECVTAPGEIRIQRSVVLVRLMQIASGRIRLPNFDERMRNRPRVLIHHSPAHDNSFAKRFAAVRPRQIASLHIDRLFSKQRPRHFRKRVRYIHQRLRRRALNGGHVRRMKMRRLRARSRPPISHDVRHPIILLLSRSAQSPRSNTPHLNTHQQVEQYRISTQFEAQIHSIRIKPAPFESAFECNLCIRIAAVKPITEIPCVYRPNFVYPLYRSNDGVDGVEGDAHAGGRFECGFQKTLAHRGYACGTGGTCGNASSAVRQIGRRSQLYDLARSRPGGNSSIFASEAATYHFADQRQDRIFPRCGASLYLHAFATWIRRLRG